jgi:ribosomal protein S12 methylthiotransferase accessory factor
MVNAEPEQKRDQRNKSVDSILEFSPSDEVKRNTKPPIKILLTDSHLVESYANNPPFFDEPKLFGFHSKLIVPQKIREYNETVAPEISIGFAGGCSLDKNRAFWKLIGESIERYSLFTVNRQSIKGSFNELSLKHHLLDPSTIQYSKSNKNLIKNRKTPIDWMPGYDLLKMRDCLIPTQLIAVPYWDSGDEIIWRAPITTGAAVGKSMSSAIYGGLCEVIERDAFMVAWLKQLQVTRVIIDDKLDSNVKNYSSKLLRKTLIYLSRYNLEPEFYLIPNDIGLYVTMCVLRDYSGKSPHMTIGLDAEHSIISSLLGSLEESLQVRPWTKVVYHNFDTTVKTTLSPECLEDRVKLWLKPSSIEKLNCWLDFSNKTNLTELFNNHRNTNLTEILDKIRSLNISIFFSDLTSYLPIEIRESGFNSVKVVIPEYQPLYLIERLADWCLDRLEGATIRLNRDSLCKKNEIFSYPHPML